MIENFIFIYFVECHHIIIHKDLVLVNIYTDNFTRRFTGRFTGRFSLGLDYGFRLWLHCRFCRRFSWGLGLRLELGLGLDWRFLFLLEAVLEFHHAGSDLAGWQRSVGSTGGAGGRWLRFAGSRGYVEGFLHLKILK